VSEQNGGGVPPGGGGLVRLARIDASRALASVRTVAFTVAPATKGVPTVTRSSSLTMSTSLSSTVWPASTGSFSTFN